MLDTTMETLEGLPSGVRERIWSRINRYNSGQETEQDHMATAFLDWLGSNIVGAMGSGMEAQVLGDLLVLGHRMVKDTAKKYGQEWDDGE